jgi:carbamoyltransferase
MAPSRILALSGCIFSDSIHEATSHDSSASLLIDGKLVAACEEERLNRWKHSAAIPIMAIKFCLKEAGVEFEELDAITICWNFQPGKPDRILPQYILEKHHWSPREVLIKTLEKFGFSGLSEEKIYFYDHHLCHAAQALFHSPFVHESVMTVVLDGQGDGRSVTIYQGISQELVFEKFDYDSLGFFYLNGCGVLGYGMFDEYKVRR